MRRTSWGTLAATAVGSGLVSWVAIDLLASAGYVAAQASWLTVVFLLVVATWLLARGRAVRRMVAGKESSMTPIGAAKVVSLAKASSITGSLLAGFFAARLVVAAEHASAPLNRELIVASAVNLVACAVLVGVAMVVEGWCRLPPEDEPPPNSSVTLA